MNDCINADIRDRLPELLHEQLDAETRALVMAHVDGCADCRAELELLRGTYRMLTARTPQVDVARIVQALPARRVARRPWVNWQMAAAATILVIGGSSLAIVNHVGSRRATIDSMGAPVTSARSQRTTPKTGPESASAPGLVRTSVPPRHPETASVRDVASKESSSDAGLSMTGRLGELSEGELQTLLKEIDQLQAVPMTEPEPVAVPIVTRRRRSPVGA